MEQQGDTSGFVLVVRRNFRRLLHAFRSLALRIFFVQPFLNFGRPRLPSIHTGDHVPVDAKQEKEFWKKVDKILSDSKPSR
jgi:hypothetical protein